MRTRIHAGDGLCYLSASLWQTSPARILFMATSRSKSDPPSSRSNDGGERTFVELGLDERLVEALTALGYEEPTPIQVEAIPHLLEGRDLVGQAATGTGKSAAFCLPLLQRFAEGGSRGAPPSILMLVPTRELAMQLAEAAYRYGRPFGVRVLPIYGGQSFSQQLKVLKRGVDVVVATPGRALDHLRRGTLQLDQLHSVVLDEADEMLDMGFAEDLDAILEATPEGRQTVLFSATMPPRIAAIASRHLQDPVQIRIAREEAPVGEAPQVREVAYLVSRAHKIAALGRVLDMEEPEAGIIFCRTRNEVDELTEKLNAHGHRAEALHGGMTQEQRDRVMKKLRGGEVDLLTATDVAARGLDIARLTHVINFDVPNAPEGYVHRIGRVGRAGREGVAILLAEPRESRLVQNIERLTRRPIRVARLPTVADLRDRRLGRLREALLETLGEGELDLYMELISELSEEFDPEELAAAALKLAQSAMGQGVADEREIPQETPRNQAGAARKTTRAGQTEGRSAPPTESRNPARGGRGSGRFARLFVGIGREAGVRPKDLVGAITGETGISGGQIGKIEIGGSFSIVEVMEDLAEDVIQALHGNTIKGRRVTVRPDQAGRRG